MLDQDYCSKSILKRQSNLKLHRGFYSKYIDECRSILNVTSWFRFKSIDERLTVVGWDVDTSVEHDIRTTGILERLILNLISISLMCYVSQTC